MIVFESSTHGTLCVANMIDIDGEVTDDIELAMRVVCPLLLPNGECEWLCMCACARCGKLSDLEVH